MLQVIAKIEEIKTALETMGATPTEAQLKGVHCLARFVGETESLEVDYRENIITASAFIQAAARQKELRMLRRELSRQGFTVTTSQADASGEIAVTIAISTTPTIITPESTTMTTTATPATAPVAAAPAPTAAPADNTMSGLMAQMAEAVKASAASVQAAEARMLKMQEDATKTVADLKTNSERLLAQMRKDAQEAIDAATLKTAGFAQDAENQAKKAASMADAINAARQAKAAAGQSDDGPAWYESTPAKVVGGLAIGAGIAAAGYYGWQYFTGSSTTV